MEITHNHIIDNQKPSRTPYDDAYKTMVADCRELLLPLLNETFGTTYDGTETVILENTEQHHAESSQTMYNRVADSAFTVRTKEGERHFLYECESSADGKVIIRFFEYAIHYAIRTHEKISNEAIRIRLPHMAVLFLRKRSTTPSELQVHMETPDDQKVAFSLPILRLRDYTIDDLLEKKLYILLPFVLFLYEKEFDTIETDQRVFDEFRSSVQNLKIRMEELCEEGAITGYQQRTILAMLKTVTRGLAAGHDRIRKEVESIMGGQVLMHEAKYFLNKGLAEGQAMEREKTERERLRADQAEKEVLELKAQLASLQEQIKQRSFQQK